MVKAFYGRAAAYDEAFAIDDDGAAMQDAIRRNVFGTTQPEDDQIALLSSYAQAVSKFLGSQADENLLAGKVEFPPLDTSVA